MCLGIPGKIIEIYEANGLRMGKVDFGGGVIREACLAYVADVELGDYTIIHVGFAISKIDEEEALEDAGAAGRAGPAGRRAAGPGRQRAARMKHLDEYHDAGKERRS